MNFNIKPHQHLDDPELPIPDLGAVHFRDGGAVKVIFVSFGLFTSAIVIDADSDVYLDSGGSIWLGWPSRPYLTTKVGEFYTNGGFFPILPDALLPRAERG